MRRCIGCINISIELAVQLVFDANVDRMSRGGIHSRSKG